MSDSEKSEDINDAVIKSFGELGLKEWLVKQCAVVGILKPSPIQMNCVPKIMEGRDVIGCAKTGSGKTAAFVLPMLHELSSDPYSIFALVLTPTRELAHQIAEHFTILGKPISLKISVVIGGRDIVRQAAELSSKPHIVVATPGRLADHLINHTDFSLNKIKFLVLDEADRLLEDKFGDQLSTIFQHLPPHRQTLLFTATYTEVIKKLQNNSNNKPFFWMSKDVVATVDNLDQRFLFAQGEVKSAYLVVVLQAFVDKHPRSSAIIFVKTCKFCQILSMVLKRLGFDCMPLHSLLSQKIRLDSLAKFRSSHSRILVATDVASRGLDIPTVDLIINENVPTQSKNYIHRVGRTARAGRGGMAITIGTPHDKELLDGVEEHIGTKLATHTVDEGEVAKVALEVRVLISEAEITLEESDFGEKRQINREKQLIINSQSESMKSANNKNRKRKRKDTS